MGMRATLVGAVKLYTSHAHRDLSFAAAAIKFNEAAIRKANSKWIPVELFRFATDQLSTDPSVALTTLFETVYKIHNQEEVFAELERVLRTLYFHTGVFVDRSYDRPLVGEPDAFVLDFYNESFSADKISPADDGLQLELRPLRFD